MLKHIHKFILQRKIQNSRSRILKLTPNILLISNYSYTIVIRNFSPLTSSRYVEMNGCYTPPAGWPVKTCLAHKGLVLLL